MIPYVKEHELMKLKNRLQLPLTDVRIYGHSNPLQVELFYHEQSIGWIYAVPVPANGSVSWRYDFSTIHALDWKPIFEDYKNELTQFVRHELNDSTVKLKASGPNRFYVIIDALNSNVPAILLYSCSFQQGGWVILPR